MVMFDVSSSTFFHYVFSGQASLTYDGLKGIMDFH